MENTQQPQSKADFIYSKKLLRNGSYIKKGVELLRKMLKSFIYKDFSHLLPKRSPNKFKHLS